MPRPNNPFTLMFGAKPPQMIDRQEESDQILDTFRAETPVTKVFLIQGVRGSGKTVLMTSIAQQLQPEKKWLVLNLNPRQNLLEELADRLGHELGIPLPERDGSAGVSVRGYGFGIGGSRETGTVSRLEDLLKKAKRKKMRILVTIDEVMCDENMRVFASQYQIFIREEHPLFLLMTGLYENIYALQNDPALTFLLRTPKVELRPLQIVQILIRYKKTLGVSEEKAEELAVLTRGYAFAFQALGVLCWDHPDLPMEELTLMLDGMLDEQVYRKIWEGLTGVEKQVVLAIGTEREAKIKDIAGRAGITSNTMGQYRIRLLGKGIVTSPGYGALSLTLPRFYEVVRRYTL